MGKTTKPVRIPLVYEMDKPRDSSHVFNEIYIENGYVEKHADGKTRVHKRKGLQLQQTLAFGSGQGLTRYDGRLWNINGDRLVWSEGGSPPSMVASCAAWTTQSTTGTYGWTFGARMIVFQNKIWRLGGEYALGGWPKANVFSTTNGVDWVVSASNTLWGQRRDFGLVEFRGKLWLFGGYDGTNYKNDVWSSDNGVDWVLETSSAAWSKRYGFGFVASNDGIYLVGGIPTTGTPYLGDVWFTSDGVNWTQLVTDADVAPIYRRAYFDMLFYDNKIWVIGGYRYGGVVGYLNNVAHSTDGVNWTESTAAAFATARSRGSCTVYDGKMWHIVGIDAGVGARDQVYSSTDGATWTLVGTIPEVKYGATIATWKSYTAPTQSRYDTIWIFAGISGLNTYSGTLNTSVSSIALSVLTGGERFRFAEMSLGASLVFKNLHRLWVFNGNTATLVTSPNVPKAMVDGIAVLDDYVFVMDKKGVIYNSKLNNPLEWNSLDFITAEYASDEAVYITRYLNYVVAMKERTVQFFQDVGNPLGSPLQPLLNATLQVGCLSGDTVAQIDNVLIWVGRGAGGIAVYMLEGFQAKMISIPSLNQDLARRASFGFKSAAFKMNGHSFYTIATLSGSNDVAYVYDITTGIWSLWQTNSGHWKYFDAVEMGAGKTYLIGVSTHVVYLEDASNVYNDVSGSQVLTVKTPAFDFETNRRKFMPRVELICTKQTTSTISSFSYSDDNGSSWVSFGNFDEQLDQPALWRLGSFRKRAFRLTNAANSDVEWEAIECEIST